MVSVTSRCPWNPLFGAFVAVWIGVAVGSVLEEVILRRTLQREIKRRTATGEDDMTFFDQKRAASMEQWHALEDEESLVELPEIPGREDKLQAYLEMAAAGQSPIDYCQQLSGDLEDRPLPLEHFQLDRMESNGDTESDTYLEVGRGCTCIDFDIYRPIQLPEWWLKGS